MRKRTTSKYVIINFHNEAVTCIFNPFISDDIDTIQTTDDLVSAKLFTYEWEAKAFISHYKRLYKKEQGNHENSERKLKEAYSVYEYIKRLEVKKVYITYEVFI